MHVKIPQQRIIQYNVILRIHPQMFLFKALNHKKLMICTRALSLNFAPIWGAKFHYGDKMPHTLWNCYQSTLPLQNIKAHSSVPKKDHLRDRKISSHTLHSIQYTRPKVLIFHQPICRQLNPNPIPTHQPKDVFPERFLVYSCNLITWPERVGIRETYLILIFFSYLTILYGENGK